MTEDRKNELSQMCRLEIRRTVTLAQMSMSDYRYHFVESVFDVEFHAMIDRLKDKPVTDADIPTLRELVLDDLWPRLKAAHREHREVAFERLVAETNDIVVHDAEFAFDIGWIPIVQDAAERMRTYPESWKVRLDGGKEKFGCLVLHVSFMREERGAEAEVRRMREEIRLRSLATCDICGGQGRLRLSSVAKTVCDKHAAVLGEMRDDDGVWADPWRWHDEKPLEDHITEVIATGRAIMAAAEESALGKRIDDDTWKRRGREQELLIEFSGVIEDVVNGACVKEEFLDGYIAKEIDGWLTTAVVPVSDRDREFLHGYLRELIDAEYERVKSQAAERNK